MPKGFVIKNNLTKDTILKIASIGLIVLAVSTSPYFLHRLVREIFKEKTEEMIRKRARKLKELQKRKLIEFKEMNNGEVRVVLSQMGKKLVRQYNLEDMNIKKPKKWDGMWRIIIYDIPQSQRKASNALRIKLRNLGLYQIQKSVWVSPYECLPEIEFLCAVFDIDMNEYVCYFKTKEIPKKTEIRNFFF